MAISPGETALAVFFVLFLLIAFVVIYLILIGFTFTSFIPGPPPTGPPPTGPNTGNPPSSCNASMLFDDNNCCVTGVQCATSVLQFCIDGSCQCTTGSILCETAGFGGTKACVFTSSNILNCGGCGIVCSGGMNCCNGQCVDVLSPSQTGSCGGCGVQCTTIGSTCCNGMCRTLTTDFFNCGACLNSCGSGQLCCSGNCTGPNDNNNCGGCGISCTPGNICQNGFCVPGCPTGFISCAGQCLNPLNNNFNCGRCSNPCANGSFCNLGTCSPNVCVNAGEIFCPEANGCVNVTANRNLCGDCSTRCTNGACLLSRCQCQSNFDCLAGYTCQSTPTQQNTLVPSGAAPVVITLQGPGFCMPPPCFTPGTQFCSSTASCTSVQIDPLNCGQCGTICRSGTCNAGLCSCTTTDQCPPGSDCLLGTCVLH